MSRPLHVLDGVAAPLALANVDTDSILPSRFMKTIGREGLGAFLFHTLRFDEAGAERPGFVLNRTPWRDAVFLIAHENFGCGSSREHAPWALLDFGIRCIVAPSFADIFANNCLKNGILPLPLDAPVCDRLIEAAGDPVASTFRLDLEQRELSGCWGTITLAIDPGHRHRLLLGLDDIDETLRHADAIAYYEDRVRHPRPVVPPYAASPVWNAPRAGKTTETEAGS